MYVRAGDRVIKFNLRFLLPEVLFGVRVRTGWCTKSGVGKGVRRLRAGVLYGVNETDDVVGR